MALRPLPTRQLTQVIATGDVGRSPIVLHGVTLTASDLASASVVLRDGQAGDPLLTLRTPAGTSYEWVSAVGALALTTAHVTIVGVGASVSVEYAS